MSLPSVLEFEAALEFGIIELVPDTPEESAPRRRCSCYRVSSAEFCECGERLIPRDPKPDDPDIVELREERTARELSETAAAERAAAKVEAAKSRQWAAKARKQLAADRRAARAQEQAEERALRKVHAPVVPAPVDQASVEVYMEQLYNTW